MEACTAVEKEIDKIVAKFASIKEHGSRNIDETIEFLSSIKPELEQGKEHRFFFFQIICLMISFLIKHLIPSSNWIRNK